MKSVPVREDEVGVPRECGMIPKSRSPFLETFSVPRECGMILTLMVVATIAVILGGGFVAACLQL